MSTSEIASASLASTRNPPTVARSTTTGSVRLHGLSALVAVSVAGSKLNAKPIVACSAYLVGRFAIARTAPNKHAAPHVVAPKYTPPTHAHPIAGAYTSIQPIANPIALNVARSHRPSIAVAVSNRREKSVHAPAARFNARLQRRENVVGVFVVGVFAIPRRAVDAANNAASHPPARFDEERRRRGVGDGIVVSARARSCNDFFWFDKIQNVSRRRRDDRTTEMPRARRVVSVAMSGAVQNAVVPLFAAVQLALFGLIRTQTSAQAAFGLVALTTNVATTSLNFLADGVAAKVGRYLGRGEREEAGAAGRLALTCALLAGGASAASLTAALRDGRMLQAFGLDAHTESLSKTYFWYRTAAVPFACVFSCAMGILSGIGRVNAATGCQIGRAASETLAVVFALVIGGDDASRVMRAAGVGYFVAVVAQAVVGTTLTLRMHTRDGDEENHAYSAPLDVFGAKSLAMREAFDFVRDGLSMWSRSVLLQASFLIAMGVAARSFDAAGLAAHHIVTSLWMICSHLTDGYATAAVVIGSRLFGAGRKRELINLSRALVGVGVVTGALFSAILIAGESGIPNLYTRDEATKSALLSSGVWRVLVIAQPVNAACFVYDGFIYATHSFEYIREVMASGVGLVFLPALFFANRPTASLRGIWTAKLALNVWRVFWLAARVHVWLPTQELERVLEPDSSSEEDDDNYDEDHDDRSAPYEPLISSPGETTADSPAIPSGSTPGGVRYESSLKPSKIKNNPGLSPIRTPELALARSSNLRASADQFQPR